MLQAQIRIQQSSLILLFMISDKAVRVKEEVDDKLGACEFAVIGKDYPKNLFSSLVQESVNSMFRTLQHGIQYFNIKDKA